MELQKNKGYKAYFFAAIAVAIVGILLYAIVNIDSLKAFINRLMLIFGPVIYGVCIAYLCNPIMKVFDNYVFKKVKFPGLRRALSLTMTVIVVLLGISVVIGLLVPEIIRSIQHLFANYDSYLEEVIGIVNGFIIWLEKMIGNSPAENAQYIQGSQRPLDSKLP